MSNDKAIQLNTVITGVVGTLLASGLGYCGWQLKELTISNAVILQEVTEMRGNDTRQQAQLDDHEHRLTVVETTFSINHVKNKP